MSFLSLEFGLFLAAGFALFLGCPRSWRPGVLLGLSLAFYLTYVPEHLLLLLGTAGLVHLAVRAIERAPREQTKVRLAWAAAAALVALLALYKCLPLFGPEGFVVPLGLSYYFFKLLGYLLDVYWEKERARRRFLDVVLYAAFFPQIVSGPIQRAGDFFGQLDGLRRPEPPRVVAALRRILLGLFKKLVIAQRLGLIVNPVHERPGDYSPLELLLAAYFFAFQLYADFSGLTDIALGIGELFGIAGPENFNLPFWAPNLQEYWRRWHMSLTSWLGDYFFQPLRLSLRRWGQAGLVAALVINMVAIGIWHGVRWTYAVFGLWHGVMLAVSATTLRARNLYFKARPGLARARAWLAPLVTFHLAVFPLVVFRAGSLALALDYFRHLVPGLVPAAAPAWRVSRQFLHLGPATLLLTLAGLGLVEAVDWARRRPAPAAGWFGAAPRPFRWGLYYACILAVFLSAYSEQKFFYAQF